MTSIISEIESWFGKKEDQAEVVLSDARKWALANLEPLALELVKMFESQGLAIAEQAVVAGGEAALGAISGGASVAGQAALAAMGAIVKIEAPDALHALSTAAVTKAKQAVAKAAEAIAEAPKPVEQGVNE